MTKFTTLILAAATAATAAALPNPFPAYSLEARQDGSNCTQYCSISAGCTCTVRPSDCTALYEVQPDDTCTTIAEAFGNFTVTQFYKWNPSIGRTCFGLQAYVPVCIDTPWYTFTPPIQPAAGTKEGPEDVPVPLMPSTAAACKTYELTGAGTRVDEIAADNGITVDQWSEWNGNATGAWAGYWSCVEA
ncbi:hypothetical protein SLS58_007473 [Diplodia intermedia]|uniref:LysM domain-containing protein n=1 Tax=Diplodia intermedia TaxID=856260 RepID=A0ABR3TK16_9PEZI